MKIHKYELEIIDEQQIVLPQGYKILDVQMQMWQLVLWAIVNPKNNDSMVNIKIRGTGQNVSENETYLGTFQCKGGSYIGHVFEG